MNIGICKLCDQARELQRSHVIGRSVFRNMLKPGEHYTYTASLAEKRIVRSNDQWATPMLCSECEQLLNNKYENYSLWALKNKQHGVKHRISNDHLVISNLNQYRVGMYILSIFWRASQSEHRIFANIEITEEINNYLKSCIYGNSILDSNAVKFKIAKLKCSRNYYTTEHLSGIIINPILRKINDNSFSYFMIFSGYYFEITFFCSLVFKCREEGVLKRNKRILRVPFIDLLSIPEIRNGLIKTKKIHESQIN
ncbi:hypothetical protein GWP85_13260 [Acinetobacter beijerinckii]|uniref:hypothetical protein n=1 Tax=Acinetobacter beijerinckii TaxID=262668 RepID=UPI0023DE14C4|nr:hypothetical protein [Acinetobacter beijerinckii]MDF2418463.1 hypothetical protein [Acinetobacter beijerinckii]